MSNNPETSCFRKIQFFRKYDAELTIIRRNMEGVTPYKCKVCGHYHIGHKYKSDR